jgi:DNA-binding NarL/FixJ family response regulator
MYSIGLIDDDRIFCAGFEDFIHLYNDLTLAFVHNSIEKWNSHLNSLQEPPFFIFLDIGLPGISGLNAISIIKERCPNTKIIILSGNHSTDVFWQALCNGADGYLLKPVSFKEIRKQIDIIIGGGAVLSPGMAKYLISRINSGGQDTKKTEGYSLTKREKDVLQHLVKGFTYKEVSNILNISTATVNDHIKKLYIKMDVNSKSELILKVLKDANFDSFFK